MKIIKFFPLVFAFFVFDCSASFFERESSFSEQQMDKIDWAYASNIWFMKVNPGSIYHVNSMVKLDAVDLDLGRGTENILPDEIISHRSTITFLVGLVVQMSIDMFVQSNIGMNRYKNLLMGMDTMLTASNDLLGESESQGYVFENSTDPDFSVKAVEKIDVSEVPVPNGIWLFLTAFLGGIGFGKRFKLGR
jgi:hypothetical protein